MQGLADSEDELPGGEMSREQLQQAASGSPMDFVESVAEHEAGGGGGASERTPESE